MGKRIAARRPGWTDDTLRCESGGAVRRGSGAVERLDGKTPKDARRCRLSQGVQLRWLLVAVLVGVGGRKVMNRLAINGVERPVLLGIGGVIEHCGAV